MRIGIDAHMLGDNSGGNESFYKGILHALRPNDGDEFFLFIKPGFDGRAYEGRFKVIHFNSNNAVIRNLIELPMFCKKYNLELLHTQYYVPLIRPCCIICTIHDISFEHHKDAFSKSEYLRDKLLVPFAVRRAIKIVTVSNFSKEDILNTYDVGSDKVTVVYNATDSDFRQLSKDELNRLDVRGKYNIGRGKYIIYVGNIQPRKNITRLIKAFRIYKDNNDADIKLVIAGKTAWHYYDEVKKTITETDRIIMTGYIEKPDLIALMNESEGLVYPSIFEGFGLPPLEAINCGIPVAVSDIPAIREVLGDSPIYFNPYSEADMADAIGKLLSSQKNTEKFTNIYSWEKSAEKLMEIYEECVQ